MAVVDNDVVIEDSVKASVVDGVTGLDAIAISTPKSLMKPLNPSNKVHSLKLLSNVTARQATVSTQNVMHSVKLRS